MERTQTIRDFMMQCECFEYSQEHYDLMKEAMEADLMDQFIQNQLFISENADSINTPDGYMFTEGCFMESTSEDNLIAIYEKKEEKEKNIFQRIWAGIKNIFSKIGNFFKRLFGAGKDYKKMYEDLKEKSKDLEERLDETVKKLAKKKQAAQDAGKLVNDKDKEIKKLEEENKKLKEQRNDARDDLESQKKNTKKLKRTLKNTKRDLSDIKDNIDKGKVKNYLGVLVSAFIKNPNINIYEEYMNLLYNDILKPAYERANFPTGRLADMEYKLVTINDGKEPALAVNSKIDPKIRTLYNLAFAESVRFQITNIPENTYLFNYGDMKIIFEMWSKFMNQFTNTASSENQSDIIRRTFNDIYVKCRKSKEQIVAKGLTIKSLYAPGGTDEFTKRINAMQDTQNAVNNKNTNADKDLLQKKSLNDKNNDYINTTMMHIYTSINKSVALMIPLYRQYDQYIREVLGSLGELDNELRQTMNYDAEKNQKNGKKKEKNSNYDFSGGNIEDAESSQKEAEQVLADNMKEMKDESAKK